MAATVPGLLALTRLIYATRDYRNGAAQIDAADPTCAALRQAGAQQPTPAEARRGLLWVPQRVRPLGSL